MELLGHHLGPKWSQKRQHEGLKSDLGSSRGGQGVSKALNVSILGRFSSLYVCYFVFLCVFVVRMVLCMQFGTLTWILFLMCLLSFQHGIFYMAASSHCTCFSQYVGRGQGSAAGAAEDHMTCMLDALKCMGLHT